MKFAVLAFVFFCSVAHAEDVFRIEIGKGGGSESELRYRVLQLERAVDQLQRKVFQLESGGGNRANWTTCYIKTPFDGTFSATEPTETAARAKALEKCSNKASSTFCQERELKCGQ